MSKVSVFEKKWIDLVFEGRNQKYGAYQLRQQNPKHTVIALFLGVALVVGLISIPVIANKLAPKQDTELADNQTELDDPFVFVDLTNDIPLPDVPEPEPVIPEPPAEAAAPVTATTEFTTPVIVSASEVTAALPTIKDFENSDPGQVTTPGNPNGEINIGTPNGTGDRTDGGTANGDENGTGAIEIFKLDVKPDFPGGMNTFYKTVSDRFTSPDTGKDMTLKVFVSFIVEKDGSMSNIKVIRDPGYGMGNEAIRVLKSIKTKWNPGIKNGKPVRTAYNLPITLNIRS
ncbi:energy transducer TonB [Flavobacterium rakeshii]|uniref:Energy transducer TonB n=1 Tax=Flavobacterium rakeshii TaxID=1038845 RepID=A0A6N8HCE1_9FLAO|nr:energy transducer TonB [Flavobacterium rakeshii]MUV03550.1 energy transducer TonB [Flavobacterium rakeshii]